MSNIIFPKILIKTGLAAVISVSLAACEDGNSPSLFKGNGQGGGLFGSNQKATTEPQSNGSIKLVERDVEAPEVFQVTEKSLWDGRPSLGGVWVAHPDSKQPERVIIRNETNGKFVIGALFKRERDNPGPRLQLSSDAANALGVLAGAPTTLNVTVLRRETVTVDDGGSPVATETVTTKVLKPASTDEIESSVLKSVAEAEAKTSADTTRTVDIPTNKPITKPVMRAPKKPVKAQKVASAPVVVAKVPIPAKKATTAKASTSGLSLPYIQLGFFSIETNANNTLKSLETRKIPGKVTEATAKGKTFWRVLAGPAQTKGEQSAYLTEIKKMGFSDAYLTKN
ncbi:MAG: SPOR domain-containing protein [Proteobacteria bacterium]|nr:SPOR domain-containing protein [Pseudomonadota bacterium]